MLRAIRQLSFGTAPGEIALNTPFGFGRRCTPQSRALSLRQYLPEFFFLAFLVALACPPLFYKGIYFRDYSIIWEGAYRLYLGQIPYRDFDMPVGYGSLLFPALFFKAFGPTMKALVLCQVFLNFLFLLILDRMVRLFCRPEKHSKVTFPPLSIWTTRILSALFFTLSYCSSLTLPWYNSTAFLFEMLSLLAMLSSAEHSPNSRRFLSLVTASGALSMLTFMTKQDCGVFAAAINLSLVLLVHRKNRKNALLIYLGSLLVASAVLFLPFAKYSIFQSFNFGLGPHYSRASSIYLGRAINFFPSLVSGIAVILFLNRNKQETLPRVFLAFGFVAFSLAFQGSILSQTSGLSFTNEYALPFFFPVLFFLCRGKRWPVHLLTIGTLLWSCQFSFGSLYRAMRQPRLFLSWSHHPPGVLNDLDVNKNQKYTRVPTGAFEGAYVNGGFLRQMQKLNLDLKKRFPAQAIGALNMSELTPLAADLNFVPARGVPLWFHSGITLFGPKTTELRHRIESGEYDVIFIQNTHYGTPRELFESCEKGSYDRIAEIKTPHELAPVLVYARRN